MFPAVAVFAVVPLIKRRMTGQIAGMTGAYGNVGAVTFLTILSFVNYSTFFYVIAATALVGLFTLIFMDEPRGQIAEVAEDGTVHMIDVSDPKKPFKIGVLPRPKPPADAKFTDFCQRRGSFGPKRTGYQTQPGTPKDNILPFAFYNAGLQVFDVSNLDKPEITAYFVPPFDTENVVEYARGNLSHGVYIEYDRNLFWLFTNHGIYLLSSPVLGDPNFGAPKEIWPSRK